MDRTYVKIAPTIAEEPSATLSMHPKKFAMWLFLVTVVMVFASLTSAYIVRQSEGDWLIFDMPDIFLINSAIILASSVTMHLAYMAARKDNFGTLRLMISLTALLGVAFLVGQFIGWSHLVALNVYLVGNPAGGFVYVLTGLHGLHLISGVIFLMVVLVASFKMKVHSKNMAQMEMCVTYWHFLDGLWLYLLLFLLLNQ